MIKIAEKMNQVPLQIHTNKKQTTMIIIKTLSSLTYLENVSGESIKLRF